MQERDYRRDLQEDKFDISFSYFIEDFDHFIFEIVDGIEAICPSHHTLVNLWHIKDVEYFGAQQIIDENDRG